MAVIKGISIFQGIVIAKTLKIDSKQKLTVPKYTISEEEIESELNRLKKAINNCIKYLEENEKSFSSLLSEESKEIFETQLMLYKDPDIISRVYTKLKLKLCNVEFAFSIVSQELVNIFLNMKDPYFKERAKDIKEISSNILKNLLNKSDESLDKIIQNSDEKFILVANNLEVNDLLIMDKEKVIGIILEYGSTTSHVAILTRSFEIPSIFGVNTNKIQAGQKIILDAEHGKIITSFQEPVLEKYKKMIASYKAKKDQIKKIIDKESITTDGVEIILESNIEMIEELDLVSRNFSAGIGLFRSEFLFLSGDEIPSEERQTEYYSSILKYMGDKKVVIRTLDVGGDKTSSNILPYLTKEGNPILGVRGIRFCFKNEGLFRTQIRALLKASVYGNLHVMFPMISHLGQFLDAKEIWNEERERLLVQGIKIKENIPLGITMEVPSAAMISDILAKHSDFFSIGTNDLIQYTLAVDRDNEHVAYLYDQFNPAVLRLIKLIVDAGNKANIPVSICGELASDVRMTLFLIGVGFRELSMTSNYIPPIKYLIRHSSIEEAKKMVDIMINLDGGKAVSDFIQEHIFPKYPLLFS